MLPLPTPLATPDSLRAAQRPIVSSSTQQMALPPPGSKRQRPLDLQQISSPSKRRRLTPTRRLPPVVEPRSECQQDLSVRKRCLRDPKFRKRWISIFGVDDDTEGLDVSLPSSGRVDLSSLSRLPPPPPPRSRSDMMQLPFLPSNSVQYLASRLDCGAISPSPSNAAGLTTLLSRHQISQEDDERFQLLSRLRHRISQPDFVSRSQSPLFSNLSSVLTQVSSLGLQRRRSPTHIARSDFNVRPLRRHSDGRLTLRLEPPKSFLLRNRFLRERCQIPIAEALWSQMVHIDHLNRESAGLELPLFHQVVREGCARASHSVAIQVFKSSESREVRELNGLLCHLALTNDFALANQVFLAYNPAFRPPSESDPEYVPVVPSVNDMIEVYSTSPNVQRFVRWLDDGTLRRGREEEKVMEGDGMFECVKCGSLECGHIISLRDEERAENGLAIARMHCFRCRARMKIMVDLKPTQ